MQLRTQKLALMSLFSALTIISAFIRIPIPGLAMVFTAQVFVVLLSGLVLGAKAGFLAQLAYILIGLCGFPVFSKGGGFQILATPEGGFLFGFLAASATCGALRGKSKRRWFLASIGGVLAMYVAALGYIAILFTFLGSPVGLAALFQTYCLAFLPVDLIKCIGAAITARTLERAMPAAIARS